MCASTCFSSPLSEISTTFGELLIFLGRKKLIIFSPQKIVMKFLSANNFVNTTLKLEPKAKRVNVVFSVKETVEDKFGKINAIPILPYP